MRNILIFFLLFVPLFAQGGVYRWVDENGQIYFGSVPPKMQKPYKAGELKQDEAQQVKPEQQKTTTADKDPKSVKADGLNKEKPATQGITNENNPKPASILNYKPKTVADKQLEKEKEKERSEKFDKLIKRLKRDVGDIPNKNSASNNEVKDKSASDTVNKDDKQSAKETGKSETSSKASINAHETEITKEIESVEQATEQDNDGEKCGFFKSFVENYKDRIKYECPSEHCDLLRKKLEKYQSKVKQYCGNNPVSEKIKEN